MGDLDRLLRDPIHAGKMVAVLPTLGRRNIAPAEQPTVLVNTGGVASLSMHIAVFAHSAKAPAFAF